MGITKIIDPTQLNQVDYNSPKFKKETEQIKKIQEKIGEYIPDLESRYYYFT